MQINLLLDELITCLNTSNDHPIIKAAVIHYQMATIQVIDIYPNSSHN